MFPCAKLDSPPAYDFGEDVFPSKIKLTMMLATGLSITSGACAVVYGVYFMSSLIIPTLVISAYLMIPGLILILLGVLFPFFSLVGCRGFVKEDMVQIRGCHVSMYVFIALTLLLAIYVSVATFANASDNRILPLQDAVAGYHEDLYMAGRINTIQKVFQCCGVLEYSDWNTNEIFACNKKNLDSRRCNIPTSCCIRNKTQPILVSCGSRVLNDSLFKDSQREELIYMKGCQKKIDYLLFTTTLDMLVIVFFLLSCEAVVLRLCSYARELFQKKCHERENSHHYFNCNQYPPEEDECNV